MARAADRPKLYRLSDTGVVVPFVKRSFTFFFISEEIVIIESLLFHAKQAVISLPSLSGGVSL